MLATHSGLLPPGDQSLGEGLVEALKQIPGMTCPPPPILPSSKAEVKPIPWEQGGQSPPVLDTLKLNPDSKCPLCAGSEPRGWVQFRWIWPSCVSGEGRRGSQGGRFWEEELQIGWVLMGVRPRNRGWIGDDRPDRNRVAQVLPSPGKRDPNEGRKGLGSGSAQSLLLLSRGKLGEPRGLSSPKGQ